MGPLVVASNLPVLQKADGRVTLTQKFVDGMTTYTSLWDGPVRALLKPTQKQTSNLDNRDFASDGLPFEVRVEEFGGDAFYEALADAAVVLGGPDLGAPRLSQRCRQMNVPCVNNFEHSLWTRLQIKGTYLKGPVRKFKNLIWELGWERKNIQSVRAATGIQCNGTPAFDAYAKHSANPMLYFDSRTKQQDVISEEELENRLSHFLSKKPIRLAFSGRLIPIKGALDLLAVARKLRDRGLAFEFDIFGDGESRVEMQKQIDRDDLGGHVTLHGVMDFQTVLTPSIKKATDLFVCCHRQGDPSCTYVETFACGVPIVGFANDAFRGLVERAPLGWTVPMGDIDALASQIVSLDKRRDDIVEASYAATRFAMDSNFDREFEARIDHLASLAKRS